MGRISVTKNKLKLRVKAAQKAVDKYKGKPFAFEERHDCGRMGVFVMKELGVLPKAFNKVKGYNSLLEAKKALKALGGNNMSEVMDKYFEAIPPASALPADIVSMPSEDDSIGAIGISLGNGVVLAYVEDQDGAVVGNLIEANAAWRILPL